MKNYLLKFISLIIFIFIFFISVAIFFYTNADSAIYTERNYSVINPAGSFIFIITDYILQYLGFSFLFLFLLLIYLIKILNSKNNRVANFKIFKVNFFILNIITSSGLFSSLIFKKYQFTFEFLPGGYLGLFTYNYILERVNNLIAVLCFLFSFLICIYLSLFFEIQKTQSKRSKLIYNKIFPVRYIFNIIKLIFVFIFKYILFFLLRFKIKRTEKKIEIKSKEKKDLINTVQDYKLPEKDFISHHISRVKPDSEIVIRKQIEVLAQALNDFGVKGEIIGYHQGPVVTMYEFRPSAGIRSSRIIAISDDIARILMVEAVRIFLITGKDTVGFEISNQNRMFIGMRERIESSVYENSIANIPVILGVDTVGRDIIVDLTDMPHLLVAGTTGSGKSVGINCMIVSILYKLSPIECRFIMIDPKRLEFSMYNNIPHLLLPVVTEPQKAILALKWAVKEMEERYTKMSALGVRNLIGYNEKIQNNNDRMPWIVIFIDEMADLLLVAGKEFEVLVQRLAQMARAAGIHLVMATQRPSVDVITGVIKANFPTRISYRVTSKIDSRTILGEQGGERLLGKGDMLYMPSGTKMTRIHGPFMSDSDIEKICNFLRENNETNYIDLEELLLDGYPEEEYSEANANSDDLYERAKQIVVNEKKTSISYLQRKLRIGYNKSANYIEQMEQEGILTEADHTGKRQIIKN